MTTRGRKTDIAELRGPINGLIVEYMRANNIGTVREFADAVNVGRSTIYDLVRGRSSINGAWMKPSLDTLTKLATALQRPTHELLYLIEPEAPGADVPMASEIKQVPVLVAGRVGAGPEQDWELEQYTYVEREFAEGRDLVAFKVEGNSMDGGSRPIASGDLVIVDRRQGGEFNSPVVARLTDDGYVCKRLRPGNFLDSTNPAYDDPDFAIIVPDRVAEVVGRVVRTIHTVVI